MSAKLLRIIKMTRYPIYGPEDELNFESGINVIIGEPSTGKSKWLGMLDYVMGDDGKPEDAFGEVVAEKYESIKAVLEIDGEQNEVERNWKTYGKKGKVYVNGEAKTAKEFQHFLMEQLGIPIVHFPKGNPYEERTWPELSWRMLFRHIYRQQRFWNNLADEQPPGEQHACLMQFLGIAQYLFSEEYEKMVALRKKESDLRLKKEQFAELLAEVSKEILGIKEVQVSPTAESLDTALLRLRNEIGTLQEKRIVALKQVREGANLEVALAEAGMEKPKLESLEERWTDLRSEREKNLERLSKVKNRLEELTSYKSSLEQELARLNRTQIAGNLLGELKVTRCPVCDQPVKREISKNGECYLCHQELDPIGKTEEGLRRLEFEKQRINGELGEIDELINSLKEEREQERRIIRGIEDEIIRIEKALAMVRQASLAIIPPEIALVDMETGRLEERILQLERVKNTFSLRDRLSAEIEEIRQQISDLKKEIAGKEKNINYETSGDDLADGMNSYLNRLEAINKPLWSQGEVFVSLDERKVRINIRGKSWTSVLGDTYQFYFLMAYHYALLELSGKPERNYPGLLLMDFPRTLESGVTVTDKENYILKPFVDRMIERRQQELPELQVIAAGNAFEGLEGANRIRLLHVWQPRPS